MKIKTNAKVFSKTLYYCTKYAMIGAFLKMAIRDWSIFVFDYVIRKLNMVDIIWP